MLDERIGIVELERSPEPWIDLTLEHDPQDVMRATVRENTDQLVETTVGRVSRKGIIPITADQDTAGPMARSVTDAAIVLGVLEGAAPDPDDPATKACTPPPGRDYTRFLNPEGLKGARIGIPRAYFYGEAKVPGREKPSGGLNRETAALMEEAIAVLKARGAVVVDPADIPSVLEADPSKSYLSWGICSGTTTRRGRTPPARWSSSTG